MNETKSTSITHPYLDFWLLGGASVVVWIALCLAQQFRGSYPFLETHFQQLIPGFALLSLVCNYPHFMASYRFGYGRGWKFILKHFVSLLAVPLALIALFLSAFFFFHTSVWDVLWAKELNRIFEFLDIGFRFGLLPNLGLEILSMSVWLMYLTVGWHYSKQVFGCVLVYSRFDEYPISKFQKNILKWSVLSVAAFNFVSFATVASHPASQGPAFFFNLMLTPLGLPNFLGPLALGSLILSALSVLGWVVYGNFKKYRKLPSWNIAIPWIAFHVWWVPIVRQPEFYMVVVPFFHSLQYLPFVYRLNSGDKEGESVSAPKLTLRLLSLLLFGFLAFELIPGALDTALDSSTRLIPAFSVTVFAVFINVHHYFIDSVVWRFDQPQMRNQIFQKRKPGVAALV